MKRSDVLKPEVMPFDISTERGTLAERRADELTANFTVPPIPVLEIAERTGVNVVFADFGKHSDTVAGFCDFRLERLYVNKNDTQARKLFTIAHELGHWLLHRKMFLEHPDKYPVLPRFQKVDIHNKYEREANLFAAHLLVPTRLLLPVKDYPVSRLADIFAVSKQMMEIRLKNV
jgi:Zn-dependent peptidase ImmA (M78 family)